MQLYYNGIVTRYLSVTGTPVTRVSFFQADRRSVAQWQH
jgi:hypothetical protein